MLWRRDGYHISTDPDRLDREAIWGFLRERFGFRPVDPPRIMERRG